MNDITTRRAIKWSACSKTDVGCAREINEDAILCNTDNGLWTVADGMGGYDAGDVASKMVIDSLLEASSETLFADYVDVIEDKLIDANHNIQEYSRLVCENNLMGSTVVSLIINGRLGACLWAGDSRLYLYRNNELHQLSYDHSQVEELIQQGFLQREDAKSHPEANIITRAIGATEDIFIDINVFSTQIGDTFLLCSDGLYNSLDTTEITSQLEQAETNEIVDNLIAKSLENGASDNVSVILVKGAQEKQPGDDTQLNASDS